MGGRAARWCCATRLSRLHHEAYAPTWDAETRDLMKDQQEYSRLAFYLRSTKAVLPLPPPCSLLPGSLLPTVLVVPPTRSPYYTLSFLFPSFALPTSLPATPFSTLLPRSISLPTPSLPPSPLPTTYLIRLQVQSPCVIPRLAVLHALFADVSILAVAPVQQRKVAVCHEHRTTTGARPWARLHITDC